MELLEKYEQEKNRIFDKTVLYICLGTTILNIIITISGYLLNIFYGFSSNEFYLFGLISGAIMLIAVSFYFKGDEHYKFPYFLGWLGTGWVAVSTISGLFSIATIALGGAAYIFISEFEISEYFFTASIIAITFIQNIIRMFIWSLIYQLFKNLSYKSLINEKERKEKMATKRKKEEDKKTTKEKIDTDNIFK